MSSDTHFVHAANSEPGRMTRNASAGETSKSPRSPDSGPKAPYATSNEGADVTVGKEKLRAPRRVRVTNNLVSTVFSTQPIQTDQSRSPKSILRRSYISQFKSHENIFGANTDTNTRPLHRREPSSDTKQNLFGDPLPLAVSKPSRQDTFGSLFGTPELQKNSRRPYEEDTYVKLFGDPDQSAARRDPRENTQENLFGPPIVPSHRPSSRAEDTQEDLFGPPLPTKSGRTNPRDRTTLDLFKASEEKVRAPHVLSRAGRINAGTQDKLFGEPLKSPPPPALREDTSKKLFGLPDRDQSTKIALYEDSKYNPITGEGHAEKHTSTAQPKPCIKRAPTPAPGTSAYDKDRQHPSSPKGGKALQLLIEKQKQHWDKVNTITGEPHSYSSAVVARKVEC